MKAHFKKRLEKLATVLENWLFDPGRYIYQFRGISPNDVAARIRALLTLKLALKNKE